MHCYRSGSRVWLIGRLHIKVRNDTGYDMYSLNISHDDSTEWEEDVLDEDVLETGQTVKVNLSNYVSSIFDIQAEDKDGNTYTIFDVDVSTDDLTLTRKHMD